MNQDVDNQLGGYEPRPLNDGDELIAIIFEAEIVGSGANYGAFVKIINNKASLYINDEMVAECDCDDDIIRRILKRDSSAIVSMFPQTEGILRLGGDRPLSLESISDAMVRLLKGGRREAIALQQKV